MKNFLKKLLKTDEAKLPALEDRILELEQYVAQAQASVGLLERDLGVATDKITWFTRELEEVTSRYNKARCELDEVNSKLQLISSIVSCDPKK